MFTIATLDCLEILDSRGRPTLQTTCRLASGASAAASIPSGASTGAAEAIELRDRDPKRYLGLGCRRAVQNVRGPLREKLSGCGFASQEELDCALCECDGTANKSHLGANAILSVSLAFARACALQLNLPLWHWFSEILGRSATHLPRPTINLFSGGKHAGKQSPLQDLLIVPASARTMDEALSIAYAVYQAAAGLIMRKYGMRALTADEGGLAPAFPHPEAMLDDAVEAIREAGLEPRADIALAVDVASSHFFCQGIYELGEERLASSEMIARLAEWTRTYPIVSIEDGLAEDEWEHWPKLRGALHGRSLTVGDDLLCTNPARVRKAVALRAADTLLLKVNQVGTLTEAREACLLARDAGWQVTFSARSGETEDHWLADLSVGWSGDQIKVGSITQSERLSKYNRLLAIEQETSFPIVSWPSGK